MTSQRRVAPNLKETKDDIAAEGSDVGTQDQVFKEIKYRFVRSMTSPEDSAAIRMISRQKHLTLERCSMAWRNPVRDLLLPGRGSGDRSGDVDRDGPAASDVRVPGSPDGDPAL